MGAAAISLYLSLSSVSLSPEEISARVGAEYDRCYRLGERRGKTNRIWDRNVWEIVEKFNSSYANAYEDLPKVMDRLLSRVEACGEQFAALATGGSGELSVVIQSNGYPGMGFDTDLLARIARLRVSMDFDLYCDSECERVHADKD